MSLRPPKNPNGGPVFETGVSILDAELAAERAAAFGRLGRALEAALAKLAATASDDALEAAAQACWGYFVQRESIGLYDHRQVIKDYAIPGPVLARMGAVKR